MNTAKKYGPIVRGAAIVSGIFSLIVALLLIINYIQTQAIDPLNSPALQSLMEQFEDNPTDELLKEQIRALDLLARKAYFTQLWHLRTGGYLLLAGVSIFLLSLKIMASLNPVLPQIDVSRPARRPPDQLSRRQFIIFGTSLFILSLVFGVLSRNELMSESPFLPEFNFPSDQELLENWTNFRGPGGNSIAFHTDIPTSWNGESGENILWKIEPPKPGFSSPVVWGDYVFITGGDKESRYVYCYHADHGSLIWEEEIRDLSSSPAQIKVDANTGYAASTAATNGGCVCAIFANGDLICLDMDGNRMWTKNLGVPDNHYAHSSSLIIYRELLFVQYDQRKNSKLFALNLRTGLTVWEVPRSVISWSSPICVDAGGRMELILTNSLGVNSYDPSNGDSLWSQACLGGEVGPSAAYADGMVFVGNEYAQAAGVRIGPSNGAASEVVWTWDEELPNTASPLATDRYVFFASSGGYIFCLNAKTGKTVWEAEFDNGFYASPILVGDLVYAMDLAGVMRIFKIGEKYQSVSEPELGEGSSCTPAFLNGKIYIRGEKNLYCIGK